MEDALNRDIGRTKGRNYPILTTEAYRIGWERIWGKKQPKKPKKDA